MPRRPVSLALCLLPWVAFGCGADGPIRPPFDDATPARLGLIIQPAGLQSGASLTAQPILQVQDSAGAPLAVAGLPIQASLASGPAAGSLTGTTTVVTTAGGRATFTDLAITGPGGDYALEFASAGLTAATSNPLALQPANPPVPLTDMTPLTYFGYSGGLYPDGSNVMPARHDSAGRARARAIVPRDVNGDPNPGGKYVVMSLGMSNTTMEWCATGPGPCDSWTFSGQAAADPAVNTATLAIVNGAAGRQTAIYWDQPTDANYDRVRDQVLGPQGLSELQVQVIWMKVVNPYPDSAPGNGAMPTAGSDADSLLMRMGAIARAARIRYPNLQILFASSRIYGGYDTLALNPEPYAFESGFAVKWLVAAQIAQMDGAPPDPRAGDLDYETVAPWIGWGAYVWANGLTPRADGLVWTRSDLAPDGVHPSIAGREKVGTMLLTFFKTSPHAACWFLTGQSC